MVTTFHDNHQYRICMPLACQLMVGSFRGGLLRVSLSVRIGFTLQFDKKLDGHLENSSTALYTGSAKTMAIKV